MNTKTIFLALLAAGLLAACGGGDDGAIETAPPGVPASPAGVVPASATSTVQAFFSFIGSLAPAERDAPLSLEGVTPPVSETAMPSPVN